jgi:hypothetical protein
MNKSSKVHFTKPPLTGRPSCYSPHYKCAVPTAIPSLSLSAGNSFVALPYHQSSLALIQSADAPGGLKNVFAHVGIVKTKNTSNIVVEGHAVVESKVDIQAGDQVYLELRYFVVFVCARAF